MHFLDQRNYSMPEIKLHGNGNNENKYLRIYDMYKISVQYLFIFSLSSKVNYDEDTPHINHKKYRKLEVAALSKPIFFAFASVIIAAQLRI